MSQPSTIEICCDADIVTARQKGREMAADLGFSQVDMTMIVTSISELARNILLYAGRGRVTLQVEENHTMRAMVVVAADQGPGIPDIRLALQDGFSTSRGLGLGLPGVRRLMDEFHIESNVGLGTTVTAKMWKR